MNTRKFSRTMDEAFPFGPSYGCAIEKPSRTEHTLDYVLACAVGVLMAYGMIAYFTL